jgi:hypothetical protein
MSVFASSSSMPIAAESSWFFFIRLCMMRAAAADERPTLRGSAAGPDQPRGSAKSSPSARVSTERRLLRSSKDDWKERIERAFCCCGSGWYEKDEAMLELDRLRERPGERIGGRCIGGSSWVEVGCGDSLTRSRK